MRLVTLGRDWDSISFNARLNFSRSLQCTQLPQCAAGLDPHKCYHFITATPHVLIQTAVRALK